METRCRCTECREWFVPVANAATTQMICGSEDCRRRRRRKLARRRRAADVDASRADERQRQQKRRAGAILAKCHAPGEAQKHPEALAKVRQIVDKAIRRSRAGWDQELRRIVRQIEPIVRRQAVGNETT